MRDMRFIRRAFPFILSFSFLTGGFSPLSGQEGAVEVSGFVDVQYIGGEDRFDFGQVEIDLASSIAKEVDWEIAIVLEEGAFTTGAMTVDFHMLGRDGSPFRQAEKIDRFGIIVGQLDVPFGIDWHVYSAAERRLVSGPLVVDNTHGGWNDIGLQGYLEAGRLNTAIYAVNGFECELGDEEMEMGLSLGGRVGFSPTEQLELGGSYAAIMDLDYQLDMGLIGADVQLEYQPLAFKGEFIAHTLGLAGASDFTHTGFYAQTLCDLDAYFLFGRYGRFTPDAGEDLTRVSVGGGWKIKEGCELRFEQQINSEEKNLSLAQLLVIF